MMEDLALPADAIPRPVLITGVGGFIAGHLAERLCLLGVAVRGTARQPAGVTWLAAQGVDVVQADLLDRSAMHRAAAGCRAVVHAAAWTGGAGLPLALAWETNVRGTENALDAAREAGAERFIYLSSVAVYGLNRAPSIDESMPTPPVGQAYPDSKIAAEALVRSSRLPSVIVRPASTYGPRGGAWTLEPVQQIKAGRLMLLGADDGLITPGYIDNVVDGLLLALAHPAAVGEAFNLCDDVALTYRDFYLAYARLLGRSSLPALPDWLATLGARSPVGLLRWVLRRPSVGPWTLHYRRNPSQFSVAKAKRLLGYTPKVDFAEGMRRTGEWLAAQGYLS